MTLFDTTKYEFKYEFIFASSVQFLSLISVYHIYIQTEFKVVFMSLEIYIHRITKRDNFYKFPTKFGWLSL